MFCHSDLLLCCPIKNNNLKKQQEKRLCIANTPMRSNKIWWNFVTMQSVASDTFHSSKLSARNLLTLTDRGNVMIINAEWLDAMSKQHQRKFQELLPELVKRLIINSCTSVSSIRMVMTFGHRDSMALLIAPRGIVMFLPDAASGNLAPMKIRSRKLMMTIRSERKTP